MKVFLGQNSNNLHLNNVVSLMRVLIRKFKQLNTLGTKNANLATNQLIETTESSNQTSQQQHNTPPNIFSD